jgi:hypothetical protein
MGKTAAPGQEDRNGLMGVEKICQARQQYLEEAGHFSDVQ